MYDPTLALLIVLLAGPLAVVMVRVLVDGIRVEGMMRRIRSAWERLWPSGR